MSGSASGGAGLKRWFEDCIAEKRAHALRAAGRARADPLDPALEIDLMREAAAALELAVFALGLERPPDDDGHRPLLAAAAADGFRLLRALPLPGAPIAAATQLLRAAALAALGDRGADAARWLRELETEGRRPALSLDSSDWGERCRATMADFWLRLAMQAESRGAIPDRLAALRAAQQTFEPDYLRAFEQPAAKRAALEPDSSFEYSA